MAQILRFGVVGGVATLVHLTVASLIIWMGAGFPVWLTNLFAFIAAFWVSFVGHSHFTFKATGSPHRFAVASLAGFATNNLCLAMAYWATRHDLISIVLAALTAPVVVYLISRFWVFNERA